MATPFPAARCCRAGLVRPAARLKLRHHRMTRMSFPCGTVGVEPRHLGEGMAEAAQESFTWQDVLDFERARPGSTVAKQLAVRARFGLSPARYYQLLNRLIDRPEALR